MEESPVMLVRPAIAYVKKYKKPLIMYEMDLWPESLLAGGIIKDSLIYKHYKKVSANIYSKCDKILVSTKEHILYIKDLPGCKELDIEYLPQYADTVFEESNYGNKDNGVIDLMFAGNIGKAQSADTIIRAAAFLKDDPRFKFHIVGSGSELENIKKLATELNTDNVVYMDSIFSGCTSLTTLPQLNTSNLKYAGFMFYYCSSLTTISGFDFSNVVEIQSMFAECRNLQELDIRTLDFNSASGIDEDFLINVPNNCHIKVSSSEFKDLLLEYYPDLTNIEVVNN